MNISNKFVLYKSFKFNLRLKKCMLITPTHLLRYTVKFRCINHKLPIEVGRYSNIDSKDRICYLCYSNDVGDSYHVMFNCTNSNVVKFRRIYIGEE